MTERKILFRGFHPDENGKTTITIDGLHVRGEWVYWDGEGELTPHYWQEVSDWGFEIKYAHDCNMIYKTIGRWATTRNGKDVFEGDRVQWKDNGKTYQGTVCYFENSGSFLIIPDTYCLCENLNKYKIEVIGNTWESEVTE